MTTITSTRTAVALRPRSTTTLFERALLSAASALDSYVNGRLARRTSEPGLRAITVQMEAAARRRAAEAHGAFGILPR